MTLFAPLLVVLLSADPASASTDEIEWEEFVHDACLEAWTIRKQAKKTVKDGCLHVVATEEGDEFKLDRTLLDFELSYEFNLDKGVGHELWLESSNGLLTPGAGFGSQYAEGEVTPQEWHTIRMVRHRNESFVSVDDKKLSAKPMSLGAVMLRFFGSGQAHVRKLRLLDESTTLPSGDRAKDHTLLNLKGLPHLKIVDVSDLAVTDVGAAHLAKFKSLRWVDLRGTKVSAPQAEKLKQALPECFILHD